MADACCNTIIGGEVYIVQGDRRFEALGDVTLNTTQVARTGKTTSAGRLVVTEESRPARAKITFANHCDADPLELFDMRCSVNVTVVEKSRGFRHLFTNASLVGDPENNLSNGEVSGIEIVTDAYAKT